MPPEVEDKKRTNIAINELGDKYNQLLGYTNHLSRIVEIQAGIITNLYAGLADSIPERYMKNDFYKRVASLVIDLNRTIENKGNQVAKEAETSQNRQPG